jgi:hypothetical protein
MATAAPLSQDPALEASVFWHRFQREIIAALGVLIVVGLGWGAYSIYTSQRESAAAAQLAAAKTAAEYETVIRDYGNTSAGASAQLFLGGAQRKDKKYAESNATLQSFIDKHPDHELAPAAQMGIAANLEAMGKTDEAIAAYQQVASKYSKSYLAPLGLISQVPLLKQKNQTDAARRVCEAVIAQYNESFWAGEAAREMREMRPTTTAPTPTSSAGANPAPPLLRAPETTAPNAPAQAPAPAQTAVAQPSAAPSAAQPSASPVASPLTTAAPSAEATATPSRHHRKKR